MRITEKVKEYKLDIYIYIFKCLANLARKDKEITQFSMPNSKALPIS